MLKFPPSVPLSAKQQLAQSSIATRPRIAEKDSRLENFLEKEAGTAYILKK